jgi:glycosyltransferase involved in cell wall biosynthesis
MSLISIIIPMRNAEPFVAETVRSLLAQCDIELEIIVIDDGSTDRSAEVVRAIGAPQVRITNGPQRGISAAVNAGIDDARGEYVCRCDADDLYPTARLSRQAAFLDSHADFGAICSAYSTIDPAGRHVADHFADQPAGEITDEILAATSRSHMCAYLFRTSLLRQIGGCREWFVTSEDADLQYRLAEVTRVWFDPTPAYLYRVHDSSITHTQKSAQRRFFEQCAKDFLAQRRSMGQDDLQRGNPPSIPTTDTVAARSSAEQIQQLLVGQAWKLHAAGSSRAALSTGFRACRARPINLAAWRSLIALMIKPRR